MRTSKYDRATLARLVASSASLSDVIRGLGLTPNGGNHRMFSALVRRYELDTSHFRHGALGERVRAIPRETLEHLVASSTSLAQVLTALDLPTKGRAHYELKRQLQALAIDTSHLRGAGWSRGETASTHASVARARERNRRSDDDVFVANSPEIKGRSLAKRLLALGWTYACATCGISTWRNEALVLHLDHRNGVHNDNRLSNLRFLLPQLPLADGYLLQPKALSAIARLRSSQTVLYEGSDASVVEWQTHGF